MSVVTIARRVRSDVTAVARNAFTEVFNAFDHANYGSYLLTESTAGARYGQPAQNLNVAYSPRMLQLGFRVTF